VHVGDTVTWVNKDATKRKVAANPHPSASSLPGLVSGELAQGESYTYTFTAAGDWYYHDYLNPIKQGKVTVQ
ncbi:MAG: hypothetical protein V1916_00105, partial [Patescibacteria group bacterium]